ncbi:hypothetical protein [Nocardia arthritidis]|uniref:Uncharacterized protein n=1 Tax=Nocardia arthritidis TaxID=228602 RepID=A0A6G9YN34_9NOCA|nr:hypothetical protein [Nocardia arthritidis]QIS14333.1 hypothetical protein F5544_32480 [Nocardia arthritidis]
MPSSNDELLGSFSEEERRELASVTYRYRPGSEISLDRLLAAWAQKVSKLDADRDLPADAPQAWGAHDVVGTLRTRDRIAAVVDSAPEPLRQAVERWLVRWDDLYRSFTVEDPRRRLIRLADLPETLDGWWWRRAPVSGPAAAELDAFSAP